jgi:1-acyl-sn-glycerol-3-phosphate acyltransferase
MIGEFKPGAFKLSYRTGASIIPCALYGTFRPLSTKTNLKINPIWIKFFDPIEKNDFLQINTVNMAPMVQGMIQQEITNNMKVRDADFVTNLKNKKSK